MKRRLKRARSEISEHRGKEGGLQKRILGIGWTRKKRETKRKRERKRIEMRGRERKKKKREGGRERRRCRDYHIMVPRGRISCATT